MDTSQFVERIHRVVYLAAIEGTKKNLSDPPGRAPRAELVQLSDWYKSLSDDDRSQLDRVVALAADHAVFGVMAVLDGVRVVENGGADIDILYRGVPINPDKELHELFRNEVDSNGSY